MKLTSNQRRTLNENRGSPPTPERYQKTYQFYKSKMGDIKDPESIGRMLIRDIASWVAGDHDVYVGELAKWDLKSITNLVSRLGMIDYFNDLVKYRSQQSQQYQNIYGQATQQLKQAYQQLLSAVEDQSTRQNIESDFYEILKKLEKLERTGYWPASY